MELVTICEKVAYQCGS